MRGATRERSIANWRGPDEPWPDHRDGVVNDAIDDFRAAGWSFAVAGSSSHVFGRVVCRRVGHGDSDACTVPIYGTPKGGPEQQARILREDLARCTHRADVRNEDESTTADPQRAARIRASLRRAERLVVAAEGLITARRLDMDATLLLRDCSDAVNEADQLLMTQAIEQEEAATLHRATAQQTVDEAGGVTDPWPPDDPGVQLLDPANHALDQAERQLRRPIDIEAEIRSRINNLRSRIDEARTHLTL